MPASIKAIYNQEQQLADASVMIAGTLDVAIYHT